MDAPEIVVHGVGGEASPLDPSAVDPVGPQDPYTDHIDLSNACRQFYVSRLKAADAQRQNAEKKPVSTGHKGLDAAMQTLKKEMASLMEQDLSLMKQLLTLNEQIEELKWQRKIMCYLQPSRPHHTSSSSCSLLPSTAPQSCWTSPGSSALSLHRKYPSPSQLSLLTDATGHFSSEESLHAEDDQDQTMMNTTGLSPREYPSTRSTSDLGSSGDDSSMTDLTGSVPRHHNVPRRNSGFAYHNALRDNSLCNGKASRYETDQDTEGYFSMDKERLKVPINKDSRRELKGDPRGDSKVTNELNSFDSGIQDSESAGTQIITTRL